MLRLRGNRGGAVERRRGPFGELTALRPQRGVAKALHLEVLLPGRVVSTKSGLLGADLAPTEITFAFPRASARFPKLKQSVLKFFTWARPVWLSD